MPRKKDPIVRLSSKGQIIVPASLRRRLGLQKGQAMQVRPDGEGAIIFTPVDEEPVDLETILAQARAWYAKTGRDPVKSLHRRRRRERRLERIRDPR